MFKSILYFISIMFKNKNYDIAFVYLNHFNREGENPFFKNFIEVCKENNINYIEFEETDLKGAYSHYPRNPEAVPLDFITLIQVLLRKIFTKKNKNYSIEEYDNYYKREKKVSKIIKDIFFRKFNAKMYIVLANNNVTLWREINPLSKIIDYQHGMIWNGHDTTLINSKPHSIKIKNNIINMVYGRGFKELLIRFDKTGFYSKKNIIDIGFYQKLSPYQKRKNKRVILYSLQNVDLSSNKEYYEVIKKIIYANKNYFIENNYQIIFKNHPRYDRNDKLIFEEELSFLSWMDDNASIDKIIDDVSLHITSKSTTAFDFALKGIPTIFVDMLESRSPREIFFNQYNYPINEFILTDETQLQQLLPATEDDKRYQEYSKLVYDWAREFYQDFDEEKFLNLIKKATL